MKNGQQLLNSGSRRKCNSSSCAKKVKVKKVKGKGTEESLVAADLMVGCGVAPLL